MLLFPATAVINILLPYHRWKTDTKRTSEDTTNKYVLHPYEFLLTANFKKTSAITKLFFPLNFEWISLRWTLLKLPPKSGNPLSRNSKRKQHFSVPKSRGTHRTGLGKTKRETQEEIQRTCWLRVLIREIFSGTEAMFVVFLFPNLPISLESILNLSLIRAYFFSRYVGKRSA